MSTEDTYGYDPYGNLPKKRDYEGNLREYLEICLDSYMLNFTEVMDKYKEYEVITITKDKRDYAEIWLRLKKEEERFVDGI